MTGGPVSKCGTCGRTVVRKRQRGRNGTIVLDARLDPDAPGAPRYRLAADVRDGTTINDEVVPDGDPQQSPWPRFYVEHSSLCLARRLS